MYWLHALTLSPVWFISHSLRSAFFGTRVYMRRKVVKKYRAHPQKRQQQQQLCKTLTCVMKDFELKGENEDSVYRL